MLHVLVFRFNAMAVIRARNKMHTTRTDQDVDDVGHIDPMIAL